MVTPQGESQADHQNKIKPLDFEGTEKVFTFQSHRS
jgi:hypothetical protein